MWILQKFRIFSSIYKKLVKSESIKPGVGTGAGLDEMGKNTFRIKTRTIIAIMKPTICEGDSMNRLWYSSS